jgi:nucleoside-diphosphate-sugar epimerase
VYGRNHSGPVEEFSVNPVRVNQLEREDYYGIARLNAEAKHRSFQRLSIIDLRVFSFFSRYIDLNDGYFINEVINCLRKKDIFYTDSLNIVRDYIHPEDLYGMVLKCMAAKNINSAFDAHSKKPITKKEMLEYFRREYGLKYEIQDSLAFASATGRKNVYYSENINASNLGYYPKFASIEAISEETTATLSRLMVL